MITVHERFRDSGGWYLSPTSASEVLQHEHLFGMMETPRSYPGRSTLRAGWPWAYDNDAFNGSFDFHRWARGLLDRRAYKETCLFVAVPDAVGDHRKTLRLFDKFAPILHRRGWPVALVTQDGLKPRMIRWPDVDALFIGGTDDHKLGDEARQLIKAAHKRGKWIHVGRVNSQKRILRFWQADSWDGTTIAFEPAHAHRLSRAVVEVRQLKNKQLRLL